MRAIIRWTQSNQGCWALACLILFSFLLIYRPLNARTQEKNTTLQNAWNRLTEINYRSLAPDRLDLNNIARCLERLTFTNKAEANQTLLSRIEIAPFYRDKISEKFQHVDYEARRQSDIESLSQLAQTRNTRISPTVFENFPPYHSDLHQPNYLWSELTLTRHLLQSLIYAEIESIAKLSVRRQKTPSPAGDHPPTLIPVISDLEFACESSCLARLLIMLPLRSEEIQKELGIDYPPYKPGLYIEQILIQKDLPERPAYVTVWMKIVGFISPLLKAAEPRED